MIAYLSGTIAHKQGNTLIVEVGGIGYDLAVSLNTQAQVGIVGDKATLLTYLQVREDGLSLFGFGSGAEKEAFERLVAISGVGPKAALAILSYLSPLELAYAALGDDEKLIKQAPGVGPKLAKRIVLELKSAYEKIYPGGAFELERLLQEKAAFGISAGTSDVDAGVNPAGVGISPFSPEAHSGQPPAPIEGISSELVQARAMIADATEALLAMGFTAQETEQAFEGVYEALVSPDPTSALQFKNVSQVVSFALSRLG